jgi:hypothetical protein
MKKELYYFSRTRIIFCNIAFRRTFIAFLYTMIYCPEINTQSYSRPILSIRAAALHVTPRESMFLRAKNYSFCDKIVRFHPGTLPEPMRRTLFTGANTKCLLQHKKGILRALLLTMASSHKDETCILVFKKYIYFIFIRRPKGSRSSFVKFRNGRKSHTMRAMSTE